MAAPQLLHIKSLAQLRQLGEAWDDLWLRSAATLPTLRLEHLEHWIETFAPGSAFRALAVEQDGRLLAALPLIAKRLRGVMTVGMMPSNEWTPAADLLLDRQVDVNATLDLLVSGVPQLPWSLLWLDACLIDQPRWLSWRAACERAGLSIVEQERFRIPRTEIETEWESYRQSWSRNHRRNMTRYRRKLADERGEVALRMLRPTSSAEIGPLLRRGFAIEDRSWKGAAGSSVLRSPGMFDFFIQQAERLAARGELEVAFLDLAGEPIAFHYAWSAKQVYHPFKIGYDEAYGEYCPGQLLMHDVLERMFLSGDYRRLDCVGPTSPATAKWETTEYIVGRQVIAPRRLGSQAVMYAYQHLWPTLRRWSQGASWSPSPALPGTDETSRTAPKEGAEEAVS